MCNFNLKVSGESLARSTVVNPILWIPIFASAASKDDLHDNQRPVYQALGELLP